MLAVGLDVGSTTVKGVVVDQHGNILWKKYERHRSRQTEKVEEFLHILSNEFGLPFRLFTTGSGGTRVTRELNSKYFQEVNALSFAVEQLHPRARTVFELGGQDAKFILWRNGQGKFSTMNDRCAGGTGATIDRIIMKLNLTETAVRDIQYSPERVYPVAGKCGVFAETDINSLQKQGIPQEALVVSLFNAIVEQNLSVLVRGFVPEPDVLLLGGPNVFFPALRQSWRRSITELWNNRRTPIHCNIDDAFETPVNALYYGAYGAALLGMMEDEGSYLVESLPSASAKAQEKLKHNHTGSFSFFRNDREKEEFFELYARSPSPPMSVHPAVESGSLPVYIGVDGGSTSTKGVVLNEQEELLWSAYKLSGGNPLLDARDILLMLREKTAYPLNVQGIGFTGYAKDLLKEAFGGDTAIVETVAHTLGSLKYFPDADVICDVGGQDIKVILLKNGTVKDFRLNTQCSAGNGYYLQSTAQRFGYRIEEYADHAFLASNAPEFNFGCAVFLESDIVNFQQLGWQAHEIMAGLAKVLPLNVWLYVVQEPNLSRLGKVFVLQGGTHNNLAVVKAQIDFISSRVKGARIHLHPHREVAGAIGAALEAKRAVSNAPGKQKSNFIGFPDLHDIAYSSKRDEETRCRFCSNRCLRTFITITAGKSTRTYIVAGCEKGQAQTQNELKRIILGTELRRKSAINFVDISNKNFFGTSTHHQIMKSSRRQNPCKDAVIGIPRVLNIYSTAPFFRAYFESLGVKEVVFSDFTSRELYAKSSGRGSIDPCYPSKIAISHVHDLLYNKQVSHIFFPCIRMLNGQIHTEEYHWACPVVAATPEVVKAAFTTEKDEFSFNNVVYIDPVLDVAEADVLERQMYIALRPQLKISRRENRIALLNAWDTLRSAVRELQLQAEKFLLELEKEGMIGIVFLGRPYHNDPGINHGILEQLNKCGYPIFTVESLPKSGFLAERLFEEELSEGQLDHLLDVSDVWPRSYSENTSLKVWAAKFTARHPNLIALDLSSFRCGHDAMLYSVIDDIFNFNNLPYFTFHEIDENKPLGSIKLRVETIDYFLGRLREGQVICRQKSSLAV
jgi:predicted CoA-substrate-specific enzyme activase